MSFIAIGIVSCATVGLARQSSGFPAYARLGEAELFGKVDYVAAGFASRRRRSDNPARKGRRLRGLACCSFLVRANDRPYGWRLIQS